MIWLGKGGMQVEADDGTERLVRRVLDRVAPTLTRELEAKAKQVYDQARDEWPVKTGRSRDELEYGLRLPDSTTLEAFVANGAKYAKFIRGRELGYKSAVVELIRKPVRRAADELAVELGPTLRRMIEGA